MKGAALAFSLAALSALMPTTSMAQSAEAAALLNAYRAEKGRAPVQVSPVLEKMAARQAKHMQKTGTLSHSGPKGRSVGKRARAAGYRWCHIAENVAHGRWDMAGLFNTWAGSGPHAKNMANRKVREFGLHKTKDGFAVLILGQPGC